MARKGRGLALETVTVLFTDLVGSTELMAAVGEQRADELRREHFAGLRAAVAAHDGREVKSLGDGLMVVFESAGAALACAREMQQTVISGLRVGVSAGETEVDDGDYFGLPVVEAARLCAVAQGGEILITDLVRALVRSRGGFDLHARGPIELKGLPEPVDVYELDWTPAPTTPAGGVPIPRALSSVGTGFMVGRSDERARLADALKAVEQGEQRGVLVSGEPGIGKTTLTTSFALAAAERGAVVLYGRCDEDLHVPYQPWSQVFDHLAAHVSDETLGPHLEQCGPALGRIAPAMLSRTELRPSGSGAEADHRHELFAAALDLLGRAGAARPVCLVLDDLHWADSGTVQLLRQSLTNSQLSGVLVLGTFRDSDVTPTHPLADVLAQLHRVAGVERIALRGLDDIAVLEMLEALAGHDVGPAGVALRDALLAETGGNPFFLGELLRHLRDTGGIYQNDSGQWVTSEDLAGAGLPVSIREVIGRRVRWLGDDVHRVLSMAAVIGRDFDLELLSRVVDVEPDELLEMCDRAVAAAVLREGARTDWYTFAHALIERSLYDELSAARRARAHLSVAEALEALLAGDPGGRVGELAHHWARATRPSDAAKAFDYARQAGEYAMSQLAPLDAVRWFSEALALLDRSDRATKVGVELRLRLGMAMCANGDAACKDVLLEAAVDALALHDHSLAARAAMTAGDAVLPEPGRVDEPMVEMIEATLELLGPEPTSDRAKVIGVLAIQLTFDTDRSDERDRLAREAVAIARSLGDDEGLLTILLSGGEARLGPDAVEERRGDLSEAIAIAQRSGDLDALHRAHSLSGLNAVQRGDRDALQRHIDDMEALVPHVGLRLLARSLLGLNKALLTSFDEEPDAIDAAYADYLECSTAAGQGASGVTVWGTGQLYTARPRGQQDRFLPMLEEVVTSNPGLPVYRAALAAAHAQGGDRQRAAELVAAEREVGFAHPLTGQWLAAKTIWTEAAWYVRDAAAGRLLIDDLEPWADQIAFSRATVASAVGHYAGMARHLMGDLDQALQHLERAQAIHSRFGTPYFRCSTDLVTAHVLADRASGSDLVRADALAKQLLATADERGYGYLRRDAGRILDRLAATR